MACQTVSAVGLSLLQSEFINASCPLCPLCSSIGHANAIIYSPSETSIPRQTQQAPGLAWFADRGELCLMRR